MRHPATPNCDTPKTAGHNTDPPPHTGGVAQILRHPTQNPRSEHVRHCVPYRGLDRCRTPPAPRRPSQAALGRAVDGRAKPARARTWGLWTEAKHRLCMPGASVRASGGAGRGACGVADNSQSSPARLAA